MLYSVLDDLFVYFSECFLFVLEPTTSLAVLLIKCMEAEVVTVLPDFVVTSYCHTLLWARDHLILGEFYAFETLFMRMCGF